MTKPRMHVNLAPSDDEPYQWGNNDRGGCGAPLRDKGGAPIANLRKFSKENESSPRNADLRRSGRHGSNQQMDNGNDTDGSTDGRLDSRRRSSAREFDGDHDNGRDYDAVNDGNRRRNKSTFSSESPRYNSTNRSYSDSGAGSPTGSSSSPKKFMGAIKQMNSGMGDKERETKYRKEQEYQKQLRDQIEEKKRKKDEEKRGEVKVKQKEMQEYLRGHYKGDIPEHLMGTLDGNGNDDSDADNDRERGRGSPSRETGRLSKNPVKGRNGDGNYREEDRSSGDTSRGRQNRDRDRDSQMGQHENTGRRAERGRDRDRDRDSPRRKGGSQSEHDDEGQWRDRGQGSSGNDSSDSRSNRRGRDNDKGKKFQDKEGRWVSEAEYGELTSLCDRLMSQQDRLQEEIQHQAEMIKDLQRKPQTVGTRRGSDKVPSSTTVAQGLTRSKSVQHSRAGIVAKTSTAGKAEATRRPVSTDPRDSGKDKKPPAKVAFGGSAVPTPKTVISKAGRDSIGTEGQGQNQWGVRTGTGPVKKPTALLAFGGRASSVVVDRKEKAESEMAGRSSGTGSGRGALGSIRGPVIVSYDDDDGRNAKGSDGGTRRGADPKRYGARGNGVNSSSNSSGRSTESRGMELNGQSEYLRMDGFGEDVLSGDQLDRLLVQAKRVRAAPH